MVEGIYAFMYCTKWRSGQVLPMPYSLTTLKYRATQFFIKYTSGALETNLAMLINQMNIMTFGPNYETLSKSGSFGQPETLRLQITILKKSFEESFQEGFSLPTIYKYFCGICIK